MLDYLEAWRLLLAHPRGLDVVHHYVLGIRGDEHGRDP